jgi:hypothetical protein
MNNQPIDFELDKEETVADIIDSISSWARERGLIFINVFIDDRFYGIEDVPDKPLSDVETINCIIQSISDIVYSSADEASAYCNRVINFLDQVESKKDIEDENIENLNAGIEWLTEVVRYIFHLLDVEPEKSRYRDETVSDFLGHLEEYGEEVNRSLATDELIPVLKKGREYFVQLKELLQMTVTSDAMKNLVMSSIDSPDVLLLNLKQVREELPVQLENLEQIAVAFQGGDDSEGSERLGHFVDFIHRYIRLCYQLVPVFTIDLSSIVVREYSLEEKNRELQDQLNDILEVMENDDIISLTDMLEYEVRESLGEIGEYLEELAGSLTSDNG